MIYEHIRLSNGGIFMIRPFSVKDFRALHRMYPALSEETRLAFRGVVIQPRPSIRRMKDLVFWVMVQTKLVLAAIGPIRQLLVSIPRATWFAFVATNSTEQIVGFACLNILGERKANKYVAELGGVLRDDYQGKGLGTAFLSTVLNVGASKVYKVVSVVYEWNTRSIHIKEKLGFRKVGFHKNKCGETVCTMVLQLGFDN